MTKFILKMLACALIVIAPVPTVYLPEVGTHALCATDAYENLCQRGLVYAHCEDFTNAIACFDHAISVDSTRDEAYCCRAKARSQVRDYQGAFEDCNRALKINPKNPWALGKRGFTLYSLGDSTSGMRDLNDAIQLDPNDFWFPLARGRIWESQHFYDKADADYSTSINLSRSKGVIYYGRGFVRYKRGHFGDSLHDYCVGAFIAPGHMNEKFGSLKSEVAKDASAVVASLRCRVLVLLSRLVTNPKCYIDSIL